MKFSFSRACLVLGLMTGLVGCGGGSGSRSTPIGPVVAGSPQSAATVVNISDAPSDRLVSFEITVDSIVLTKSDNSTVTVLANPRRIEVTHLAGTTEPLVLTAIPEGTYISAAVSVSSPEVVFINNAGQPVEKELPSFTANVSVPISPSLIVGSGAVVLNFDLNARSSVSIDVINNSVTIHPTFSLSTSALPSAGHENEEDDDDGGLEHIIGQVTAVTANSFTIEVGQSGAALTFAVNSLTRFEEDATFASVVVDASVRVEATTMSDGTLVANEVEVVGAEHEQEAEGVITATSGNPVSSFTLLLQDGSGRGMTVGMLGSTVQVQVGPNTQFRVDNGDVDMSGWNLPQFNASSLSKAQRVEIDGGTWTNDIVNADTIKLEQQALTGTVSQFSNSQFTLTVALDSAFALLTGMNTITVYTGKSAGVDNGVSLANGAIVKVRGLLLLNPSQASYVLVASRVAQP